MALQDDAAALSKLLRDTLARHRQQTYVVAQEFVDELLDADNLAARIETMAGFLRLGFVTRLDFPAADAKVVRVVPDEDRWLVRRGAYTDDSGWAWDFANGAWLQVPKDFDDVLGLRTVCSLEAALTTIGTMEAASGAKT